MHKHAVSILKTPIKVKTTISLNLPQFIIMQHYKRVITYLELIFSVNDDIATEKLWSRFHVTYHIAKKYCVASAL